LKDEIAQYEDEGKKGADLERLKDEMRLQRQISMVISKQSVIQEKINTLPTGSQEYIRLKEMFQILESQRTLIEELASMISEGKFGNDLNPSKLKLKYLISLETLLDKEEAL